MDKEARVAIRKMLDDKCDIRREIYGLQGRMREIDYHLVKVCVKSEMWDCLSVNERMLSRVAK